VKIKILHVAYFGGAPHRDEGKKKAFEFHGCEVIPFKIGKYFTNSNTIIKRYNNLKKKLLFGRELKKIKTDLIHKIHNVKPDLVFYNDVILFKYIDWFELTDFGTHLNICNVEMDMFSEANKTYAWNQLRKSLKLFDLHFVYRRKNIQEFRDIGYQNAYLWEPSYKPWYHNPAEEINKGELYSHALFIGHYENDERKEYCEYLYKNGIDIKIHSTNWKKYIKKNNSFYSCLYDPIYGDKYPQAVYGSKASLCFFSHSNNDELAERVFEIPAMGGLLVSKRNDRLQELFEDGKEVLLFSSKEELLDHMLFIEKNPDKVKRIRDAGRKKVLTSHSIFHRTEYALKIISNHLQTAAKK